jgi:hypothetical protein
MCNSTNIVTAISKNSILATIQIIGILLCLSSIVWTLLFLSVRFEASLYWQLLLTYSLQYDTIVSLLWAY